MCTDIWIKKVLQASFRAKTLLHGKTKQNKTKTKNNPKEFPSDITICKSKHSCAISLSAYGLADPSAVQWHSSYAFMWDLHNLIVSAELAAR